MEQRTFSPVDLQPTFIHYEANGKRINTFAWLDEQQRTINAIPSIVVVQSPTHERPFIYDGNVRHAHATLRGYLMNAQVIKEQNDLTRYLIDNNLLSYGVATMWLGLIKLDELIHYMSLYASCPEEWRAMNPEYLQIIKRREEWWRSYLREHQLFGYDDDE